MVNQPILNMYKEAMKANKNFFKLFDEKRLLLEVTDSSDLIFDSHWSSLKQWENEHFYTYDLVIPSEESDSLYSYMLTDLNHYSGFYGRIEKRVVKCLALVKTSRIDKIKTNGGAAESRLIGKGSQISIHNMPVSALVWALNSSSSQQYLIIDETKYDGNIDIDFSVNLSDITALRKVLNSYDLDLMLVERELDMFVISNNKTTLKAF